MCGRFVHRLAHAAPHSPWDGLVAFSSQVVPVSVQPSAGAGGSVVGDQVLERVEQVCVAGRSRRSSPNWMATSSPRREARAAARSS